MAGILVGIGISVTIDWRQKLRSDKTAVLCMEMQNGVLACSGLLPQLAKAVKDQEIIQHGANVLAVARAKNISVVHCTAAFRADRRGTPINTPLVASLLKNAEHMLEDTSAVSVISEWYCSNDIESRRYHGLSPFTATDLDSQLRAMGVETVVVMGVSLNLGVTGLCIEAANLGYQVVVVRDAVAGCPQKYAEAVLENTISLVAKLLSADSVIQFWE